MNVHKKQQRGKPKTLMILLQCMYGQEITIELKNEKLVTGLVEEVLQNFNVVLRNVTRILHDGTKEHLEIMYVAGKMILYVHFPDHINVIERLNRHMNMLGRNAKTFQRQKRTAPTSNSNF